VAYYRHSAQDRQENSVEIQQDQVRAFAQENGIEIIREFADRGKSGLSTEDRHEFNELIRDYVEGGKEEIDFVLALDVSRWGMCPASGAGCAPVPSSQTPRHQDHGGRREQLWLVEDLTGHGDGWPPRIIAQASGRLPRLGGPRPALRTPGFEATPAGKGHHY